MPSRRIAFAPAMATTTALSKRWVQLPDLRRIILGARCSFHAAGRRSLPPGLADVPDPVARHFVNLGGYEVGDFLRRLTPQAGRVLVIGVGVGRDYYMLGLQNEVRSR